MRKTLYFVSALITSCFVLLNGCGREDPAPPPTDVSRPVKTLLIGDVGIGGVRSFPARIDASQKAQLMFRVPGKIQELAVKEATRVKKGAVIAKLDPTDFQIAVDDRQATLANAKQNYDRAKPLVAKGHISKIDFDRLDTNFKNAQAGLDAAKRDLGYTVLRAPFSGIVAKRHVEQFETVTTTQLIVDLHDLSKLQVEIDVPESIMRIVRSSGDDEETRRSRVKNYAEFDSLPGERFPLTLKEVATRADPQTQTFEVTFLMERPTQINVLPGMTATVKADLSYYLGDSGGVMIPANAVVADSKLDPRVWIVDETSMTVNPLPVKVGQMQDNNIEILEGLNAGDRIVISGVAFLVEGMKVTVMTTGEQAEPRLDEPR